MAGKQSERDRRLKELRLEKVKVLAELSQYQQANRIEFFNAHKSSLKANPKQQEILDAWDDLSRKVFTYTGGNRSGKTALSVIISICVATGRWLWSKEPIKFPHNFPRKIRIVGQDWESHIKKTVVPALEEWWPQNRPVEIRKNNVGAKAMWTDLMTKSTIEIMSNNQEVSVFEGAKHDLCYFDEPPRREVRVACARGLIDRNGRELFAMTLLKEAWVSREVIKATLDDGRPDPTVFNVNAETYDNVGYGIDADGVEQFKKTLTEEEIQARIHGIPAYMAGLVYQDFARKTHVVEAFEVPLDWAVDIAIDVHPRKKQAILFVAVSPRNDKYVCDEIWDHGDGSWIGEQIVRKVQGKHYRVNRVIIDPLAKSDTNNPESVYEKIDTILRRHGMMLETASKYKDDGIISVKTHLKGPNKKPSLFFFDTLVRTIFEIEGLMWEKADDDEKEKASKKEDDMMENLYRLCLLDTQYIPPEEEEYEDEYEPQVVNSRTGY